MAARRETSIQRRRNPLRPVSPFLNLRRYFEIYLLLLRNSLIREMNFKANFLLWTLVELLWFGGQILFIDTLFRHSSSIGDWTRWHVVTLVGTHQLIAQLFQAVFYINLSNLPELVRTGKLDLLLTQPIDAQFAVSTRQFGPDNVLNALLGLLITLYGLHELQITPSFPRILLFAILILTGISIHYSVMFSLSALSIWMTRAQGLVFAYFNLFNVGRYPDSVFRGAFRRILGLMPPVILVATVPARWLTFPADEPWAFTAELLSGTLACAILTRLLWLKALRCYGSASS